MTNKQKYVWSGIGLVLAFICYIFRYSLMWMYFIVISWLQPVDNAYISEREWLSESGGFINFADSSFVIKNDTIVADGKPAYVVLSLNKKFNEMTVLSLKKGTKKVFTSTEEFTK